MEGGVNSGSRTNNNIKTTITNNDTNDNSSSSSNNDDIDNSNHSINNTYENNNNTHTIHSAGLGTAGLASADPTTTAIFALTTLILCI